MARSALDARHLLTIGDLSDRDIETLLRLGGRLYDDLRRGVRIEPTLAGRSIVHLFFEASTRTLISFDLAAQRLGAASSALAMEASSLKKGESLDDTLLTIAAMAPDAIVIRHSDETAARRAADLCYAVIINAGGGAAHHPTQALGDAVALLTRWDTLTGKRILICGDILHSRVANSAIDLFSRMGADLRIAGPDAYLPDAPRVPAFSDFNEALEGCDAVMMLRVQGERMAEGAGLAPEAYAADWRLDAARLAHARDDCLVLHPGPMNRGVEIADDAADHARSLIQDQVTACAALRIALLETLLGVET